jgi:DNA (cytosine-5)-methyltransferase 1
VANQQFNTRIMLNGLDLFSGIGGLSIALSEWVRPIAYCEKDCYCQAELLSLMARGKIPNNPIWDDICTLEASVFEGNVDIIYGGFPCQDISIGGHGKGLAGERSGLYWEIHRLVSELYPTFVFLENVPAIRTRGADQIISSLMQIGYDCRWDIVSASEFIDQKRERWFCLAKLNGLRQQKGASERIQSIRKTGFHEELGNYKLPDMEGWGTFARSMRKNHGISSRMDRIRALGNSVCPKQAKEAFKILIGLK